MIVAFPHLVKLGEGQNTIPSAFCDVVRPPIERLDHPGGGDAGREHDTPITQTALE
jgi:hypothetical protein